jgi:hypothetical protein
MVELGPALSVNGPIGFRRGGLVIEPVEPVIHGHVAEERHREDVRDVAAAGRERPNVI